METHRIISENEELEFAIQDSRNLTSIVHVTVPDVKAALQYLSERYDYTLSREPFGALDIATDDWRITLQEAK
jgi:hypothetical protein